MDTCSTTPLGVSDRTTSPPTRRAIKIGFISCSDPADPDEISGMPHACFTALAATGLDVVPVIATETAMAAGARPSSKRIRVTRDRLSLRISSLRLGLGLRSWLLPLIETLGRWRDYERTLKRAESGSLAIASQIARERPDVLVGVFISAPLAQMSLDIPLIYASDATAMLINTTYPKFIARSRGYKLACDRIERGTLAKVTCGLFASPVALESAVRDYGLPPERARLLPLGAHVRPDPDERIDPDAPTRQNLRILVVASDPRRKRLDFCIDIMEIIKSRGWAVEMIHIGTPTRRARRSRLVRCLGQLKLSSGDHRARHKEALRQSHLCLLPSAGEMFGIAPCEAAHFGRPSVVSDAGGLPFVVHHGRTGLVLPLKADAADYAAAIESISSDQEAYLRMARQALARARTVFTWEAWARGVLESIREVTRVTGEEVEAAGIAPAASPMDVSPARSK
jgi:glycosyltransferase involved in cell wall biosynthesis